MGTRNLTCVMVNKEYKVAQYGQWDGYPGGQGSTILDFLKTTNLNEFKEKLKSVSFMTKEEIEKFNKIHDGQDWSKTHPELSRDAGGTILQLIMDGKTKIINTIGFAGNSLFCEWCYVVDFDKGVLEVYKGFNKKPIDEGRFVSGDETLESTEKYEPVVLIKTYKLNDLPDEQEFIGDLEKEE